MDAALEALVEKRKSLFNEMQELSKRERSADEEARFDAASAEYDAVIEQEKGLLDKKNKSDAVAKRMAELEAQEAAKRQGRRDVFDYQERRQADPEFIEARAERDRMLALSGWACRQQGWEVSEDQVNALKRSGLDPNRREIEIAPIYKRSKPVWFSRSQEGIELEKRADMSVGTNANGGYMVPEGFATTLEKKLLSYGGVMPVAKIVTTATGAPIPMPTWDDTGNSGALLAEAGSIGSSVAPTIAEVVLLNYKYSSTPVLVSSELLRDSAFDLQSEIASELGVRLARAIEAALTTGDNSSKPQGIVTGSSLGKTAASATSIGSDEILDLMYSLDQAYWKLPSTGFMMHSSILKEVRKLKDGNGSYLWQPSFQAGAPDTLLGFPVAINQGMQSSIATGTKTMLFGAFEKYIVRRVGGVRMYVLNELYRATDQTGFVAFQAADGRILQSAAIKHLIQA